MKTKVLIMALAIMFAMPCILNAEELLIPLQEVVGMTQFPGNGPLDNSEKEGNTPPRPTSFRATINGNSLSVLKQDSAIPSAQATVVNAQTGSIVINQQFTNSLSEQISNLGIYVLHINTEGGALVGQFIVQ